MSAALYGARRRDGDGPLSQVGACTFRGRALDSAIRTAARKLGLTGPILSVERVGSTQRLCNVDGVAMMIWEQAQL